MLSVLVLQSTSKFDKYIEELLEEIDYKPEIVHSLEDAKEALDKRRFDVYISGAIFPRMKDTSSDCTMREFYDVVSSKYPNPIFVLFTTEDFTIGSEKLKKLGIRYVDKFGEDVLEDLKQVLRRVSYNSI